MIFIRLDENVSFKIVEAAKLIRIPQGVELESARATGDEGEPDTAWIAKFATRGRGTDVRVVFSGDGQMRSNIAERVALEEAGIVVFFAPQPAWRDLGRAGQAAYLLRWLETLAETAKTAPTGAQYHLPNSFNIEVPIRKLPSAIKRLPPRKPRRRKSKPAPRPPLL